VTACSHRVTGVPVKGNRRDVGVQEGPGEGREREMLASFRAELYRLPGQVMIAAAAGLGGLLGSSSGHAEIAELSKRKLARKVFLAFEGIDGAGKTTVSHTLARLLEEKGLPVSLLVKKSIPNGPHPYVKEHFAKLIDLIWESTEFKPVSLLGNPHWLRLMAAYHAAVAEVLIKPALTARKLVIADGWYYKFMARMMIDKDFDQADFERVFNGIIQPDHVVYLEIDPERAMSRKNYFLSNELGYHQQSTPENEAAFVPYQAKVQRNYDQISKGRNWIRLDSGTRSPEELAEQVAVNIGL
jgi:dTMP kinase